MNLRNRVARSLKELLGLKQWPRSPESHITSQDELILSRLVRPGDVVFDIGANHGDLACFFAALCGPRGKVVAFEPVWRTYERFCERLQEESLLRAPIITVPLGISDRSEIVEISLPDGAHNMASIAPKEQVLDAHRPARIQSLQCGVIPLDLFVQTTAVQHPAVIKIDVEGAECKVLAGARQVILQDPRPVLFMEIMAPWLRKFGHTPWDALGWLQSVGYRHLFMCPNGLVDHQASPEHPFPEEFRLGYNVISYIPKQQDWVRTRLEPYFARNRPELLPMPPPPVPNE